MLSSNWSAKPEYLYYDLGSVTYATGGLASDIGAVLNPGTSTGVAAVATSSKGPLQGQHRSRRRELPFRQPGDFAILIGKARL